MKIKEQTNGVKYLWKTSFLWGYYLSGIQEEEERETSRRIILCVNHINLHKIILYLHDHSHLIFKIGSVLYQEYLLDFSRLLFIILIVLLVLFQLSVAL